MTARPILSPVLPALHYFQEIRDLIDPLYRISDVFGEAADFHAFHRSVEGGNPLVNGYFNIAIPDLPMFFQQFDHLGQEIAQGLSYLPVAVSPVEAAKSPMIKIHGITNGWWIVFPGHNVFHLLYDVLEWVNPPNPEAAGPCWSY